ncbi:High mobility group (HMG) box domain-containing protein [Cynara cardunculus var. scolymus]|uniref:High mobility group (HMG) box domain-containing protein n=1 Tax=Cynara cardunculus var. scolymus TaxID=59895 RepID=A0A124SBY8_CYNCS|nr:High mobility group (HMG) box domain-containing protein [Cynara cardunculus var. scolymus]
MKAPKSKSESKKPESRLSVKKRGAPAERKAPAPKKTKAAAKDPSKPKRPASAFFVFMYVSLTSNIARSIDVSEFVRIREDFRKQYKEKHPNNKSVSVVGKAGGDKWKSLTAAEKAPYVAKAETRKSDYDKNLQAYNKKLAEGKDAEEEEEEDESDKSKSEVHDDDESEEDEDEDDE